MYKQILPMLKIFTFSFFRLVPDDNAHGFSRTKFEHQSETQAASKTNRIIHLGQH